jgi:hypothetical protein
LSYTLTDTDGDVDTAMLTLGIRNDDDGVLITNLMPQAQGGDVTVDEDDLLASRGAGETAGTDATKESTTQSGTFNISAPDGVDDLTIGGNAVITDGVFTATSFTTGLGNTLAITAYNASTGQVSYTYTLNDNETHANSSGENSLFENLAVVLTDRDGDTANDILSVQIVDDVPTLTVNDIDVNRSVGTTNGTATFIPGADGGVVDPDTLAWTNQFTGYTFTQIDAETWRAANDTQTFFEITVNPDGTYAFDLITPTTLSAPVPSGSLLSGITGGSGLESFTFTADKFNGAFALVLTGTDSRSNNNPDTLTISATELGINGNSIQEQFDETLKLDVIQQPGFETATVTSLAIGVASTGSLQIGDDFSITVHYTTGSDVTYLEDYDGSGTLDFDIDSTRVVDYITFQADTANTNFKITGISLEYTQPIDPSDQDLNFTVSGVDGDGDVATDEFTVTLIAGTSGNDIIQTGNSADTVSGGAGADAMSTGGGNDILIYDSADLPGTATTVYNGGAGTDTIRFEAAGQSLDLTALAQTKIQNIEVIDLTGTGNNALTLSVQDVLDLSSTTNTLIVDGNGGDTVTATGGWAAVGTQTIGSQTYAAYTATISSQTATLLVDTDVTRVVS